MRRGLLLFVVALLGVALVWVVKTPPVAGQAKGADRPTPLPKPFHEQHASDLGLKCTECHATAPSPKPGHELAFSERPGHATCEGCHDEEFKKEKMTAEQAGAGLCTTCHVRKSAAVGSFPSGRLTLAGFSHVTHVDPHPRVGEALGIRQDCVFCHKVEGAARNPARPNHPECATCHAGSGAARPVLAKDAPPEQCLGCHSLERVDRSMPATRPTTNAGATRHPHGDGPGRPGLTSDAGVHGALVGQHPYRDIRPFNHGRHLRRRDGAPISCTVCHTPVLKSRTVDSATRRPTMRECATCHDNASFVPAQYLITNCQVCHTVLRANLRPRAGDPVSPAMVHTDAFRAHHEPQARDPDNQCGACHTGFVDIGQNNCAGCHTSMRPRSHFALRFSEWGHGRLAGMDRQACASCHTGDFCVACHNVPPRSHIPLRTFVAGAHREVAILNLRSCFVCHRFETACARCHRRELRP